MNEAYNLLKDVVGFPEKQIPEMFTITEQNGEWVIKAFRYLDGPTFGKILRAIMDKQGSYRKDETTKFAIFTLPKQAEIAGSQISHDEKVATPQIIQQEKLQEEGEYALSKSLHGKLGQLVPCLQDAEGVIIDGFHRLKVNPKAWTVKNDQIKTPVDRALARMTVNFCRRHYSSEEMKNDIGLLIGSGLTVDQIVEITGISKSTIYNYMPPEKKDKALSEAQKKGWESSPKIMPQNIPSMFPSLETPLKTPDTFQPSPSFARTQQEMAQQVIDCELCGKPMDRSRGTIVAGKIVCPKCAGKDKPLTPRKLEQEPTFKPPETWQQRKAVMQPQKSKLEMDLLEELSNRGITPETDKWICLWGTKPDGDYPDKKIAYYVHGEPHDKGKALNRDDEIRAALEKDGWTVFVFRHDEGNVKEWADKIEEALKW
jgi:hypothetical protein